jgi:acyl-CoA synthetase (AMP-forming)/AMP-acid ligase II
MLYERWCRVARTFGKETALWDAPTGRRWTFSQLGEWVDREEAGSPGRLVCPTGVGPEFVREVLRAWRDGSVVCPLEPGQAPPRFESLPRQAVHLKLTSATSGPARAVAFRAEQLEADAENIRVTMGLRPERPDLAAISLAHSYGFSNLVLPLLLQGVPLVLCGSGLPEAIRRGTALVQTAALPGVPALWRAWHDAGAIPENVQLAISAGAPLPLSVERAIFERRGLKVHNFCGATECGGIAYDRSEIPRTDPALVGQALEGVSLAVGKNGLLEVCSRAVGLTYWPEPAESLAGGVYRAQDLAELHGGLLHLKGRVGDLINVAGRKVTPEIIEQVLQQCRGVRECLVVGVPSPDDVRSEVIALVFAVSDEWSERALRVHAAQGLPHWQMPTIWHRVESIEVNERGKAPRRVWRERLRELYRLR